MTIVLDGSSGITAPGGTAAAPSITTTGDVNTGIFFPAADTIAFTEGGAEALRITSAGDVGIGTASPAAKLHVVGDSLSNTFKLIANTAVSGSDATIFRPADNTMAFSTNGSERARIDSSGNLGIGTSSPTQRLDVRAAAGGIYLNSTTGTNQVALQTNNSGGDFYFGIENSAGNNFNTGTAYAGVLWRSGANPICFVNNNTERARIDSSGNLGLGVTPSAWATLVPAFQLGGGGTFLAARSTNPEMYLGTNAHYDGTNWKYKTSAVVSLYSQDTGEHKWYRAASGTAGNTISFTELMRIDNNGDLGLGATSIVALGGNIRTLVFQGTSGAGIRLYQSTTETGRMYAVSTALYIDAVTSIPIIFSTNNTERARINASGNFEIGTTAGLGYKLSITGANGLYITGWGAGIGNAMVLNTTVATSSSAIGFEYNGTAVGSISTTSSATAYNTSSDYRLKNTIAPITGALAKVALLKPCTFKWNVDGSDGQGFIAHELAEVVPDCVTGEKDGVNAEGKPRYQGVDTSFLVATLTAAIQELTARVAALEGNN